MMLCVLFERGGPSDFENAKVGLESIKYGNPRFDENKYGMETRFLELEEKIKKVGGGK